jgi:hypothetical protein
MIISFPQGGFNRLRVRHRRARHMGSLAFGKNLTIKIQRDGRIKRRPSIFLQI